MRDESVHLSLDGVVLPDARTGEPVDLAAWPGVVVLSLIRHRY